MGERSCRSWRAWFQREGSGLMKSDDNCGLMNIFVMLGKQKSFSTQTIKSLTNDDFRWIEACIGQDIGSVTELDDNLPYGIVLAKLGKFFQPVIVRKIFEVNFGDFVDCRTPACNFVTPTTQTSLLQRVGRLDYRKCFCLN